MANKGTAFAPDLYYIEMPSGQVISMKPDEFENFLNYRENISDIIMQAPKDLLGRLDPQDVDALLSYTQQAQQRDPNKPVLANTPQGQERVGRVRQGEQKQNAQGVLQGNTELARLILREAKRIGADPVDLATVISYETKGTFDPKIVGLKTKWGYHIGLIQMGEPQREQYGYDPEGSLDSQMKAVGDYLIGRGFKPGMNVLDLYSTINSGGPGNYEAKDEAAGGMPGTVREKVETQMKGHREKATKLFELMPEPSAPQGQTPQQGDKPSVIEYNLEGKMRKGNLTPTLESKLQTAVSDVFGQGYKAQVYSGGQESNEPGVGTGTIRHNQGHAGDVYIVGPDGKTIEDTSQLDKLKEYWLNNKFGSVGTYMQGGGIHLDEWGTEDKPLQQGMALTWNY